jgi:nucleotide-binding universal stress UspA family protein
MWIQRVLCPVDYSEQSSRALRHAAAIAGSYRAALHVLHVQAVPLRPNVDVSERLNPAHQAGLDTDPARALRLFVDRNRQPVIATSVVRKATSASHEIAVYAREMQADLIVLGTHGHSGFDQVVLGSTTERLVTQAVCPVLTVPHDADEPGAQDRVHFTHVLCAVDFSPGSLAALGHGLSIVQDHGAQLTLLHVIELPSDGDDGTHGFRHVGEYADRRREMLQRLDDLLPRSARAGSNVSTVVDLGRPAPAILRAADVRRADLIVMGAHGREGLGLTLFGSATQGVLRHATCPVLTARAPYSQPGAESQIGQLAV